MAAVRPGCLVKTAVTSVTPAGVTVSARGWSGDIVFYHLKERVGSPGLHDVQSVDSVQVGTKLKPRVICVCVSTRQVYLSESRTVENLDYFPPFPTIGEFHEDGVVVSSSKMGVLLSPNIWVPQVRLSDGQASGDSLFTKGQTKVAYRVLGYDVIDDLVLAGTAASILASELVAVESAVPGQFVTATVTAAGEQSVTLSIGTHV